MVTASITKFNSTGYYLLIRLAEFISAGILSFFLIEYYYLLLPMLLYPIGLMVLANSKVYTKLAFLLFVWVGTIGLSYWVLPPSPDWILYCMPIGFGLTHGLFLATMHHIENKAEQFIPALQSGSNIVFYIASLIATFSITNFAITQSVVVYLVFITQPVVAKIISTHGKYDQGLSKSHGNQIDGTLLLLAALGIVMGILLLVTGRAEEASTEGVWMIIIGIALFSFGNWMGVLFLGDRLEKSFVANVPKGKTPSI